LTDVPDLLQSGEAWMDARRYDQALEAANRALAANPDNAAAHTLACRALLALGRHGEAVRAGSQAVANAPQWSFAHRIHSLALRRHPEGSRHPNIDRALQSAGEAVRLAPADPANHTNYAETCALAGHLPAADEAIRHALKLDPGSANAWASASYVAIKARNWTAAERAARRALALDPDNYTATNNLGVAMRAQGRWTVGAVAFHSAARIDPRSPTARDNVESIGFQYLAVLSAIPLLPLLIVWPVFVAARIGVARWLITSKPRKLRPLARRIGLRIATSKRYQRQFEKVNQRALESVSNPGVSDDWSALKGRQWVSNRFLTICVVLLGAMTTFFIAEAIAAKLASGAIRFGIAAAVFAAATALVAVWVRRRRSL
jgi:Flp pilus assembly protein TadD